jgi:hypothetical protein
MPREQEMGEPIRQLQYRFETRRPGRSRKVVTGHGTTLQTALPRITRLMALAIKLEGLLGECRDLHTGELARLGCVSRTRLTQILNLLHLAPDIQERLLWLPALAQGREVISEKSLRRLAGEYDWKRQREYFDTLLSRRTATS